MKTRGNGVSSPRQRAYRCRRPRRRDAFQRLGPAGARTRGGDRQPAAQQHPMRPEPGGWWSADLPDAGHGTDYAFARRRRRADPRPALAVAAERRQRSLPGLRPRPLRLGRSALARARAARRGALRAARRHVHGGGHLRRGDRPPRPPGRARASTRSSCSPATATPAITAGATTGSTSTPSTSPTAARTG